VHKAFKKKLPIQHKIVSSIRNTIF